MRHAPCLALLVGALVVDHVLRIKEVRESRAPTVAREVDL